MAEFLSVVLAFPTLPYSIVLCFAVLYWVLVAVGLVDDDALGSGDGIDLSAGEDGLSGMSAMFARLGVGGVPTMLVVLLVSFFGWTATYFVHLFVLQSLPDLLRWAAGALVALVALVPSAMITAWLLRPIRRLLLAMRPAPQASLLGRHGTVASPEVTEHVGYANVDDGGAGLVLQVRSAAGVQFTRGQQVVLVDYHPQSNHYSVVARTDVPLLGAAPPYASGDKENHQ